MRALDLKKIWAPPRSLVRATRMDAVLLFLIGCFAVTQVKIVGHLGISEFAMVAVAPFLFVSRYRLYRQAGFTTILWLSMIWLANAILSDYCNHIPGPLMARGIAVPIVVFSTIVCLVPLLRRNPSNLKWLLLGLAISSFISIFIFQRGQAGELAAEQGSLSVGSEHVTSYKLFWVFQLANWLSLPITGWYLSVPSFYVFPALIFMSIFNLLSGGRSMFLVTFFSLILVFIGRKNENGMKWIKKNWFIFLALMALMALAAKKTYEIAVVNGYMGAAEVGKYEEQTKAGNGILKMLMGGRGEFFTGIYLALGHPLLGHGSHAIDFEGRKLDFYSLIGDDDAYNRAMFYRQMGRYGEVSAHSHIVTYWDWHGIGALIFWLYVAWLLLKTLITKLHTYPPWYGFMAVSLPATLWDICFSPLGLRTMFCTVIVACLMLRKMSERRM